MSPRVLMVCLPLIACGTGSKAPDAAVRYYDPATNTIDLLIPEPAYLGRLPRHCIGKALVKSPCRIEEPK